MKGQEVKRQMQPKASNRYEEPTWWTSTWRRHLEAYRESRRPRTFSVHLAVPQRQGEVPLILLGLGVCQPQHHGTSGAVVVLYRRLLLQTIWLWELQDLNSCLVFIWDLKVPLHHIIVGKTLGVVWREQLCGRRLFWQHQSDFSKSWEKEMEKGQIKVKY